MGDRLKGNSGDKRIKSESTGRERERERNIIKRGESCLYR